MCGTTQPSGKTQHNTTHAAFSSFRLSSLLSSLPFSLPFPSLPSLFPSLLFPSISPSLPYPSLFPKLLYMLFSFDFLFQILPSSFPFKLSLTQSSFFSLSYNLSPLLSSSLLSAHWEELLGDRYMRSMQGNVPEGYGREEMEGDDMY